MDEETKQELAIEQAVQQELKEDEVRAKVIEEFGFDPDGDKDRIEKLVTKEIESHKKLTTAIGQKIKHRTEAEELRKKVPVPPTDQQKPAESADPRKLVDEALEKRDLADMDFPDDIKREIQRVAQIQGVSVRQAARDPYIVTKVQEHEKAKKADEAAISRSNRSTGGKKTYSVDAPPDVDMSTPEGRKDWDDYLAWAKKQ